MIAHTKPSTDGVTTAVTPTHGTCHSPPLLHHHAAPSLNHGRLRSASTDAGSSTARLPCPAAEIQAPFIDCAIQIASESIVLILSTRAIKLLHMSKSAACTIGRGLTKPYPCAQNQCTCSRWHDVERHPAVLGTEPNTIYSWLQPYWPYRVHVACAYRSQCWPR